MQSVHNAHSGTCSVRRLLTLAPDDWREMQSSADTSAAFVRPRLHGKTTSNWLMWHQCSRCQCDISALGAVKDLRPNVRQPSWSLKFMIHRPWYKITDPGRPTCKLQDDCIRRVEGGGPSDLCSMIALGTLLEGRKEGCRRDIIFFYIYNIKNRQKILNCCLSVNNTFQCPLHFG